MAELRDEELDNLLQSSEEIEAYDYRNEDDEDDYINAALYKTQGGRHFIHVIATGMNHPGAGAGGYGMWLEDSGVATWTSFYP